MLELLINTTWLGIATHWLQFFGQFLLRADYFAAFFLIWYLWPGPYPQHDAKSGGAVVRRFIAGPFLLLVIYNLIASFYFNRGILQYGEMEMTGPDGQALPTRLFFWSLFALITVADVAFVPIAVLTCLLARLAAPERGVAMRSAFYILYIALVGGLLVIFTGAIVMLSIGLVLNLSQWLGFIFIAQDAILNLIIELLLITFLYRKCAAAAERTLRAEE